MSLHLIANSFLEIIYPNVCICCGESLVNGEEEICLKCLYTIPKTNYHLQADNPIEKRFWGKVNIENATAFFHFQKGSSFQHLLHELKYKGNKEIGTVLGKYLGSDLKNSDRFLSIDIIAPVPLHPNRQQKRGYNQSEMIAKGLSAVMQKPLDTIHLTRKIENPTQTKKSVFERWENTNGIFEISDQNIFQNKHVLLVDDVLTTGSTLLACATELLKSDNTKVSIATLAVA